MSLFPARLAPKVSFAATLFALATLQHAVLAATDLADVPLASSSSEQVKPNVLFILDDSGSMAWDYMPNNSSNDPEYPDDGVGYRNHLCNYVYYNPVVNYAIPKDSTGVNLYNSDQTAFTGAYADGFYCYKNDCASNTQTKTNVSTSFKANGSDTAQAAYYWKYLGDAAATAWAASTAYSAGAIRRPTTANGLVYTVKTAGTSAATQPTWPTSEGSTVTDGTVVWVTGILPTNNVCDTSVSNSSTASMTTVTEICTDGTRVTTTCATQAPVKTALWRKVPVTSASGPSGADERQNFANWYTYYRTRILMMKSSSGRALFSLGDNYRVGFMTIHPGTVDSNGDASSSNVSSSKFLKVSDFNATQRSSWFNKLYSQGTGSATPLRTALSVAGRYYTGKNDGINQGMNPAAADDPIQYSCQQNFAILTTDGYWNDGDGKLINGTTDMTNQDGVISEQDAYNPAGSKFSVSARPMYDGATAVYTWNAASNQYRTATCAFGTQWQQRALQYQSCDSPVLGPAATNPLARKSTDAGATWGAWYIDPYCSPDNSGDNRTQCQAGNGLVTRTSTNGGDSWSAWSANPTSVCESDNKGSGRRQCYGGTITALRTTSNGDDTTPTWTAWTAATSCNEDDSGDNRRECRYTAVTSYSCPGSWSNAQCTNTDTTIAPLCRSVTGSWTDVGSCTASAQDGSGVAIECQLLSVSGYKKQYLATITHKDYPGPNQTGTQIGSTRTDTGTWTDFSPTTCYATAPSLPSDGTMTGVGPPDPPANCTSGTQAWPCETMSATGGSSNTLADVAQHYYKTDLRTSALGNCTGGLGGTVSVCDNNVPSSGTGNEDDKASWQHMSTFTMGLGLSGTLTFSPTYKTDSSGTFANIRSGSINWPVPAADQPSALDDLWHAAVNGRGQYFSAKNPDSVIDGLTSALSGINARVASAAAAATSNLEPVAGDNFAYTAKYVTQQWVGEMEAREIDLATGVVSGTPIWSAQAKLDALVGAGCDNRTIKLFRNGATNNLVDFKWDTYACDASMIPTGSAVAGTLTAAEKAHFQASGADTNGVTSNEVSNFSHYPNMSDGSAATVNQRSLAEGSNLLNFLRGQTGKEGFDSGPPPTSNDANKLYRDRAHVLGDIINAQPVFVKAPFAEYTDAGYVTFRGNQASRTPMVYVAANDGMLHAFKAGSSVVDTEGGKEAWAFVPTMVLSNLYKLASENYKNDHKYFVDGTPTAADVFDTTTSADCALASPVAPQNCWKSILVGGLNKGGQGYYALDITDPATPKALWEFKNSSTCIAVNATTKAPTTTAYTDCHIGYTFNNPTIGKLADGTWVVLVTSGYNNDDGIGYLYVLHATTGQILYRISTGSGSSLSPSGLNHINAWVDNGLFNNTITRVYGVDLDGKIWRFDVNDTIAPAGREATLVAQTVDGSGTPQPITTKPELAEVAGAPFVYVATGRYLGTTDTSTTQTQTVWAIKDPMSTTAVTDLRTTLGARVITNVGSGLTSYRTVTASSCVTGEGWFADLPDSGERVNIDIKLQLGTLVVPSNVPVSNACNIGGYGWLNYFNYTTGCAVANSTNASVGQRLVGASGTESLAVGTNIVRLPGGKTVVIATTSAAEQITFDAPFDTPPPTGKRVSWREVVQ